MARIMLSVLLGFFTVAVFIGVGESFEGRGAAVAIAAAGLAVALYLAVAQFLVTPRGSRVFRGKWPTMVAMGAPVLAIGLLSIVGEGGQSWLDSALPMVIPGCLGILAGAALAGRVAFATISLGACRRRLLTSTALLVVVALVMGTGLIPLARSAGTFPDGTPGDSVSVFWWLVALNVLVAACLALIGIRAGHGHRPPSVALPLLAFLAFMSACAFAVTAFAFRGHGEVLLIASNLALLCLAAEIIVTAMVGATDLELPVEQAA